MYFIDVNPDSFYYDVMSLIQAFYPGEEIVKLNAACGTSGKETDTKNSTSKEEKNRNANYSVSRNRSLSSKKIKVSIHEGQIDICLFNGGKFYKINSCQIRNDSRQDLKNEVKLMTYEILQRETGKELAWGTLTGIRPAKIPNAMLKEGKTEEEIRSFMRDTYMVSDNKLDLLMRISKKEQQLISGSDINKDYSLYIGIPFCPTTCLYCSFTSYAIDKYKDMVDAYIDALIRELEYISMSNSDRKLSTIYVGGGTPTTLSPSQLDRLLEQINKLFPERKMDEFTLEAGRPDSITKEKLVVLKNQGVNRISINPQTMNSKTLKVIGRHHTTEQVHHAFDMARSAGFNNINMDFIAGLPGETKEMFSYSMEQLKKISPEGFTVHSLALKRASKLNMYRERYSDYIIENSEEQMKIAASCAEELSMEPYYLYRQKNMAGNQENTGYAKRGCEGIYNILSMEEHQDIIAAGAGAVTKLIPETGRKIRIENYKNVDLYIRDIDRVIDRKRDAFSRTCHQ